MHISMEHDGQHARAGSGGAEWYGATTPQLQAFFAQLRRIPIGAWCDLAAVDRHTATPRVDDGQLLAIDIAVEEQADRLARARLREIMETMPGVVRRIRSRIDGEIGIVHGIASPLMVARMRRAARLAACAIAARSQLSPDEFERLYRPFAALIPESTLAEP